MISGILLAAGKSSRFGANKLLQPLDNGEPLILVCARNLLASVTNAVAVVPPLPNPIVDLLQISGITIVECQDAELGLGHSLRAGVAATPEKNDLLVALGDMPKIQASSFRQVVKKSLASQIVIPTYRGGRGHPIAFHHTLRGDLLLLSGDQGARDLIKKNPHLVTEVECDDPGILLDIDTREDLQKLQ